MPPGLKFKVVTRTYRLPLLLTGAVTMVPMVLALRRNSPELLMGVVAVPLRRPSAVMSNVPPAKLFKVLLAEMVRLPPPQVPLPLLFNVRLSVTPPLGAGLWNWDAGGRNRTWCILRKARCARLLPDPQQEVR